MDSQQSTQSTNLWGWHILVIVVSAVVTMVFPELQKSYDTNMAMVVGLAVASFVWMLIAMLIGPVAVLRGGNLPGAKAVAIRRLMGVWTSILLLIHLILLWKYKYEFSYDKAVEQGFVTFLVLHAAIAYVLIMGLTSNDYFVKKLGFKLWKGYHRVMYIMFPAIVGEGVYQLYRLESPMPFIVIVSLTGVLVPVLQIMAYKKLASKR